MIVSPIYRNDGLGDISQLHTTLMQPETQRCVRGLSDLHTAEQQMHAFDVCCLHFAAYLLEHVFVCIIFSMNIHQMICSSSCTKASLVYVCCRKAWARPQDPTVAAAWPLPPLPALPGDGDVVVPVPRQGFMPLVFMLRVVLDSHSALQRQTCLKVTDAGKLLHDWRQRHDCRHGSVHIRSDCSDAGCGNRGSVEDCWKKERWWLRWWERFAASFSSTSPVL